MQFNFEAFLNEEMIFHSDGHWLHPIFEFEQQMKAVSADRGSILIKDKIIGRAAALLLVRLKIKNIYAVTLSEPAKQVLEFHNIGFEYGRLIGRVKCRTEDLLMNITDPQEAFEIIAELRSAAR